MAFHQSVEPYKLQETATVSLSRLYVPLSVRALPLRLLYWAKLYVADVCIKRNRTKEPLSVHIKRKKEMWDISIKFFWLIKLQPSSVQQFIKYLILWIMIIMFSFHNFFPDVIIYYICIYKPHIPSPRSDSQIFLSLQKVQMQYFFIYRISYFLRSTLWTLRLETCIDLKNTSQIDGSLIN